MKRAACPRVFEAEAMRDGRLVGAELASFARHSATCPTCREEVRALDTLSEALRTSTGDERPVDELRSLRERTRLIADFDATLLAPRGSRIGRYRPTIAAAALMIVAIVLFARASSTKNTPPFMGVVVRPSEETVWSKHSEDEREKIVLDRGELWIRIDHSRPKLPLVLVLPDGDLVDTGTTFTVRADNGRTTRVSVQEGSVVLRITGKPTVTIGAGEIWLAEPPPAPADSPKVSAPAQSAQPGRADSTAPTTSIASITSGHRLAVARVAQARRGPDPGNEFLAAVAMLDMGANRDAAAAFARFLIKHPRDTRAEDAAYLRVIALDRSEAAEETRRAAQAYLQLFPKGFRCAEIEKVFAVKTQGKENAP
jgi:hypothetical protein